MTFTSLVLPSAAPRYRLEGRPGAALDLLVAGLIGAGVAVESITPGESYRLDGSRDLLDALAGELAPFESDGYRLTIEQAPTDAINLRTTAAPTHPFRRSVSVHGIGGAHSIVARAVDRDLTVSAAGVNRWNVAGRTTALAAWLGAALGKTTDDVHALLGLTPEIVAAEDSPAPAISVTLPPLTVRVVELPDRKTTTEIQRDAQGEIVRTVHTEVDA